MHLTIHSITNDSPLLPASRTLFTEYADFLRTLPSHACSIPNFDREIAALPAPDTPPAGELLLALIDSVPAACIAYRAATPEANPTGTTAELKRLFVTPAFRGHGLASSLVAETLTRIATRRYTRVILDTDLAHMPAAVALYSSFGFHEYGTRKGNIALFELSLPLTSAHPAAPSILPT